MSEKVRTMFAEISGKYDLMNNVLSFGIHHSWRKLTVKCSGKVTGKKVLDCASGTGDLAIEFARNGAQVMATDFCEEMLVYTPPKAKQLGLTIQTEVADAMNLPYNDNDFDISSISFGIRNVDNPVQTLKEMARVVKPGGVVAVLEFGQPTGIFGKLYQFYGRYIMPAIGRLIAGNQHAYEYLPQTAAKFPAGDKFLALMGEADSFQTIKAKKLTFGVAYIYTGIVK